MWSLFSHKILVAETPSLGARRSPGYREIRADDVLQPGEKAFYIKRDLKAYL